MDRGKRLSPGNIIGEKGELLFREWAIDHYLTSNKVTTDIGIDFSLRSCAYSNARRKLHTD